MHRKCPIRTERVRTRVFIVIVFFCLYHNQSIAQLSRISLNAAKSIYTLKGDYYRDHGNYVFAINNYNKATRQNPKDVSAMLGMADAYHKLEKDNLAEQWYRKALAIDPNVGAAHILKYISILSTTDNSKELAYWVAIYTDRIAKSGEHIDSALFIADHIPALNSNASDSGPLLYDGKLIFSSDRAGNGSFNSYKSVLNADGSFGEVSLFHEAIRSTQSAGAFAIAAKSSTLFFTGTERASASAPPPMEIFSSTIPATPSDKINITKLRFKNFNHSIGHPTVNSDGTVMYFTAHNPKHGHGFDLYRSEFDGKKWSAPDVLGATVNSHGDELYPVLYNDSLLYFASNGHGGLGGFDIYKVNLLHKHSRHAEHLPAPVNSTVDDFGFFVNRAGTEGYLSSNRPGGLGGYDLYRIYILPVTTTRKTVHEAALNQEELLIYTSKGDEIKLLGNNKEKLKFDFQPGRKYNLVIEYDNSRKGTTQTINAATLTRLNVYTFDIQKSSEAVYDQKSKSKPIQNIHLDPGDLVTFQLIPNLAQDNFAETGKIQFQRSEAIIGDRESIMFSYVAEGGPDMMPEADVLPVADLNKLDTLASSQPIAANIAPVKSAKSNLVSTKVLADDKDVVDGKSTSTKQTDVTPVTALKDQSTALTRKDDKKDSTPVQPDMVQASETQDISAKDKKADPVAVTNNDVLPENTERNSDTEDVAMTPKETEKKLVTTEKANNPVSLEQSDVTEKNVVVDKVKTEATTPATSDIESNPSVNTTEKNDIQYRVQIAASRSKLSDALLKKIYPGPRKARFFEEGGYYKYYIEQTSSYSSAKKVLSESAVKQAFISAYNGNVKLTLQEAVALQKNTDSEKNSLAGSKKVEPAIQPVEDVDSRKNESVNSTVVAKNESVATDAGAAHDDFSYRLQIAASKTRLLDAQLKKIYSGANEIRVFEEEGFYKYYILETHNFFAARKMLKKGETKEAFISAYKKNVKLPLPQAITSQYKITPRELAETDSLVKTAIVNFDPGEFELQPDQMKYLQNVVVDELRNNQSWHAIVSGYPDIGGSEVYNFGLSQERAFFVAQRIVAEGIDDERVTTQYFGESKYCPEGENCESIHRADRRVEILFVIRKFKK